MSPHFGRYVRVDSSKRAASWISSQPASFRRAVGLSTSAGRGVEPRRHVAFALGTLVQVGKRVQVVAQSRAVMLARSRSAPKKSTASPRRFSIAASRASVTLPAFAFSTR